MLFKSTNFILHHLSPSILTDSRFTEEAPPRPTSLYREQDLESNGAQETSYWQYRGHNLNHLTPNTLLQSGIVTECSFPSTAFKFTF